MTRVKVGTVAAVLLAFAAAGALGYAGWRYVQYRSLQTCSACERPVHGNTRTVAVVDGRRTGYCCPACALSEHRQTGRSVEVSALTDYATGSELAPAAAFLVRGSDVNSCAHAAAAPVGLDKQPTESHFDRCSPSLLAFATEAAARAFASQHGGDVVGFAALAAAYR